jgi:aryl carrier-like protein
LNEIDTGFPEENLTKNRVLAEPVQATTVVVPPESVITVQVKHSHEVIPRRSHLISEILAILSELSGSKPTDIETGEKFLDLGFDSLLLTQANSHFRKKFGVRITFRHLFERTPTIEALATFLDKELPPEAFRPTPAAETPSS